MNTLLSILLQSWHILLESSIFIIFGLLASGLLRVFLNPGACVSTHLGKGRISLGIQGLPAGHSHSSYAPAVFCRRLRRLKSRAPINGAVTSFLISTPESGVDSIAITYALMDPIMTVVRPVAAFFTAFMLPVLSKT